MFDQILDAVKDHLGGNQQATSVIPADKVDAIHNEIASQIHQGIGQQAPAQGGFGGILSSIEGSIGENSPLTSAISGGIVSSLASKFGLPPAATGAIAAMIPGILQKFVNKNNNPA